MEKGVAAVRARSGQAIPLHVCEEKRRVEYNRKNRTERNIRKR